MASIDDLLRRIAERAQKKKSIVDPGDLPRTRSKIDRKGAGETQPGDSLGESNTIDGLRSLANSDADVGVVVALPSPELDQALKAFPCTWTKEGREGTIFNVGRLRVGSHERTIVLATQNTMGMVPAAILATKTIRAWKPKLLAMVGICAGLKAKVNLGDVIIARHIFDYGSGKLTKGRLIPDYEPVHIDESLCSFATNLANDRLFVRSIRDGWEQTTGKPDTELRIHVGAFASGAAVVADESLIDGIRDHKRSLLGLDMEAYGVARAAVSSYPPTQFLIAKGVQDFADDDKDDQFREYAAYASAQFLAKFVSQYLLQHSGQP